ncbi:MAG TPA: threo-3-hydroxy-L-aspartate ammonia-lyase [Longimicrobiaceae bacterium]
MSESLAPELPSLESVRAAARRLEGIAHRTPVMRSRTLEATVGGPVFVKCESLQRTGSFKFRGAYNAISRLDEDARRRGVLAFSSGNHAQAVALASRLLGARATIVMPTNAPVAKLEATRGYGAEVILYDPDETVREELAGKIRDERGLALIPPYDHPDVVAGQGTAALELLEETGGLDLLVVPCGGGGLLSGTALAATGSPGCRVVGAEPELADDAARTFHSGILQRIHNPSTIADGLRTPSLGRVTWPLIREHVADIVTVSEAEIVEAMRFYWTRMKLVVEPSGAVALAALLGREAAVAGRRVGIVISGGNVDLAVACALLSEP